MGRRRQSVTIKHVAAHAGVSLQTVSRVINKEPNVRPEMMQRVQESIAALGYVPSIAAQRMGGSRSYLLLALNDRDRTIADWRKREGSDWIDQMLLGGMLTCAQHGYRMIFELVDTHSDHIERELSAALAALQPDGVILTPPHSHNPMITDLLEKAGIAFARIGSLRDGGGFRLTMGDEVAARDATMHLVGLGHRRIGFIAGPTDYELSHWRVEGWRWTMETAGLSADGLLANGDFSYASGIAAAKQLIEAGATAIVASNDQMALAAIAEARDCGMDVPRDLSVVSFDDTPVVRFHHPPLTAIAQPIAEVTARAAELLITTAADARDRAPVEVPARLVVRESTAAVPSDR